MMLSLTPLRRVIKDYFLVCESYYKAIRNAPPSQIEALDMAQARTRTTKASCSCGNGSKGKIKMDFDTSRTACSR